MHIRTRLPHARSLQVASPKALGEHLRMGACWQAVLPRRPHLNMASHAHARRLKPRATGCEARLCGLFSLLLQASSP